jgi:hypothetical protein
MLGGFALIRKHHQLYIDSLPSTENTIGRFHAETPTSCSRGRKEGEGGGGGWETKDR